MVRLNSLFVNSLIAAMAVSKRNILTENTNEWTYPGSFIIGPGGRDKNWFLTGQTGWSRDPSTNELEIDLAFIINTTDNGVPPTEHIVDDDIVNICWAIYSNEHTAELAEYEAGCATFYRGAPGVDSTSPDAQWTVTQTLTKAFTFSEDNPAVDSIISP